MRYIELTEYTTHKLKVKNEELMNTFNHYKNDGWDLVDSSPGGSDGEGGYISYLVFSKPVIK